MTGTATGALPIRANSPARERKRRRSKFTETPIWQPVQNGWRQLYGAFDDTGVSIEWHDFQLATDFEWSRSFHPESLEICLNLCGNGSIRYRDAIVNFEPLTAGFYLTGRSALRASRQRGEQHRFVTIEFSADFLRE